MKRGKDMTYKEALDSINYDISVAQKFGDLYADDVEVEALLVAAEALEKQVPKKPYDVNDDWSYFKCSTCGDEIYSTSDFEDHKYCLHCGQALDWSED